MIKTCDNCDDTFDKVNLTCAYCDYNPVEKKDNFTPNLPRIQNEEFKVEFQNLEDLIAMGFNWDIEDGDCALESEKVGYPLRNLVIYLEDITLTTPLSRGMCMLSWDTCKKRVSEHYKLPV